MARCPERSWNGEGNVLAEGKPGKPKRRFLKQPQMLRVVYALVPIALAGVYFYQKPKLLQVKLN